MMPDSGPEILKLPARRGLRTAGANVVLARSRIQMGERTIPEMVEYALKASRCFVRTRVRRHNVVSVNRDYVRDRDDGGVPVAGARRFGF
jgi:hypothetical protein